MVWMVLDNHVYSAASVKSLREAIQTDQLKMPHIFTCLDKVWRQVYDCVDESDRQTKYLQSGLLLILQ